ncbi:MAG: DUF423 domain-containing protein [Hyphomicrobium sp.]|nr:DUF423 domain-containing protein [Hyphomicrobium sp.]
MSVQTDVTDNALARQSSIFAVVSLAGIAGAAGVGLAAVAAHRIESPALATAATMLMIHAVGVLGLAAIAQRAASTGVWLSIAALMLIAVSLFSGDIALNTVAGRHIFPMAAPIGGSTLIVSWVAVAILAAVSSVKTRR